MKITLHRRRKAVTAKVCTGAEDYDVKKQGGRVGRNLALILVGVQKMNAKLNRPSREEPFNAT